MIYNVNVMVIQINKKRSWKSRDVIQKGERCCKSLKLLVCYINRYIRNDAKVMDIAV